ncbi:MAG: phosphatase PAP2 family protein [Candidatus Lokiarchaeota archaeon]
MTSKSLFSKILELDKTLIIKYNGAGGRFFTIFLKIISFLGRETIWLIFISFFIFIWYNPLLAAHFGAVFLFGLIIIVPIKELVNRIRPYDELIQVNNLEHKPTSSSFPSWHAYNITSQGLIIGFLSGSPILIILMLVIVLIVSFSRIQLGVHYPTDVLVGGILGIIGFIFTIYFFAPLIVFLLNYFDNIFSNIIYINEINPLLFSNIGYFIFVIFIFSIILLLSFYKIFWIMIKNKK